ncbi:MAG: DUF4258 domain-containing protein [Acidobacteriaceae bacterium]
MLHFDWDEHNIAHIARHDVVPQEVEYVLNNNPVDIEDYFVEEEQRTFNVGETASGRILVVVTTQVGENLRVVTAFKARKVLQELYFRRRYRKV